MVLAVFVYGLYGKYRHLPNYQILFNMADGDSQFIARNTFIRYRKTYWNRNGAVSSNEPTKRVPYYEQLKGPVWCAVPCTYSTTARVVYVKIYTIRKCTKPYYSPFLSLTRLVLNPSNNKTSWTLRKYNIFTETNPVIVMQHLTSHPWSWCPALAGSTPAGLILPSWAHGTSWARQARTQGPSFVGPLEHSGPWCRHSPTASPQAALRNFIISRCASFF